MRQLLLNSDLRKVHHLTEAQKKVQSKLPA